MSAGPSIASLGASGVYAIVLAACFYAALVAGKKGQSSKDVSLWVLLAVMFAALIASRVLEFEGWLREALREALRADGDYEQRRAFQAPLVSGILAVSGIGGMFVLRRFRNHWRGRRNRSKLVALLAGFTMLVLLALRMASLHSVDALLYGPLKLNWVVDIGASLTVMGGAIVYARVEGDRRQR